MRVIRFVHFFGSLRFWVPVLVLAVVANFAMDLRRSTDSERHIRTRRLEVVAPDGRGYLELKDGKVLLSDRIASLVTEVGPGLISCTGDALGHSGRSSTSISWTGVNVRSGSDENIMLSADGGFALISLSGGGHDLINLSAGSNMPAIVIQKRGRGYSFPPE